MSEPKISPELLSNLLRGALENAVPSLDGTTHLASDPSHRTRRPRRNVRVAVSSGLVVVAIGAPSIALAAGAFQTGSAKITTVSSVPAHSGGAYPCPSMNPPPKSFAVPPPPSVSDLRTSLTHAQSLVDFGIIALDHVGTTPESVQVNGSTSYNYCGFTISGSASVVIMYDLPVGTVSLRENSDLAPSNEDQMTETSDGGLRTVIIEGNQFILAYTPSGDVSQASFASAGTQVLVTFATPQPTSSAANVLEMAAT
jgi:hypothetical protein